ncbi:MFS transporter [Lentzea flaviverrucosa]|uniref:Drug resistance transporter, EmrB/QacA subfamily n=1 Tax=Lentzea flaviverrucosa TaxID=200379 RepID=A0A1H9F8K7_9PSEU|nr:MFS transporter [Lentzea flaviverrucosa]RDI35287.1 EmrB/QacA subfamily drug resistance transporter [Lentzea flaviverrucosa]SEQ33753.1 drug resistance transporter, EmrB/QacA subfamily [Lentzea flaviverrucosa]
MEVDARRWGVLAVVAAAQLLIVLDSSVVNIALPSAQAELGMGDAARHWVVAAYTLTFGGFLLIGGRLADVVGRKRIFVIGVVGFALTSLIGGLAAGPWMLPAARAAQGVFAALMAPAGLALLATAFTEPKERAKAFGVFGAAVGSGMAVGMVLGGVLTELGSWRWCLLINLPLAAVILVPALRLLDDSRGSAEPGYDLPGAVTVVLGLGSLIYGIGEAEKTGWGDLATLAFVVVGLLLLAAFLVIEKRSKRPMMPLRIVSDRVRGAGYVIVFCAGAALLAFYLLLAYYLQSVREFSPLVTGLLFVPSGLGIFLGSLAAGRLLPRTTPRVVLVIGLALGAAGLAAFGALEPSSGIWSLIVPAQFIGGLGIGAALTTVTKATLDGVPGQDAGVASALTNAMRQVGGAAGVATLNSVAIAATRGDGPQALTDGYVAAFLVGAALLAVAAVVALVATAPRKEPVAV